MWQDIVDGYGNLVAYYDDSSGNGVDMFVAYTPTESGEPAPMMNSNGTYVLYNTTTGTFDFSSGSTSGSYTAVTPDAPPATVSDAQSWAKLFTDVAPAVLTGVQAWQLAQINVRRASAGLPPLNTATYAPGQAGFLANMSQQGMLLLAAGLGALILLGKRGK